ncbi:DUF4190 domain-containing protein [Streptomyces sp. NPDC054932]
MSIPPQPPSSPGPYGQPGQPGPYGQPGQPGPYVGGQPGWYPPPQSQKTNPLAIVAFVMSIVCALPLVPLVLGIVALSQIKSRGEKGKGFAIAAIVIHGATIAFYSIFLILGFSGALDDAAPTKRDTGGQVTDPVSGDVNDIRMGDCFNTSDDLSKYHDADGSKAAMSVRIVPCDQPHKGEAFAVVQLDDGSYPGTEKIVAMAEEKCSGTALSSYVGKDAKLSGLEGYYYYPESATWLLGDRQISCFLGNPSGPTTGSARATGS